MRNQTNTNCSCNCNLDGRLFKEKWKLDKEVFNANSNNLNCDFIRKRVKRRRNIVSISVSSLTCLKNSFNSKFFAISFLLIAELLLRCFSGAEAFPANGNGNSCDWIGR